MTRIPRRRFMAAGAVGGLLLGSYAAYKWFTGDATEVVLSILERRLGHLDLPDHAFAKFSNEYVESKAPHQESLSRLAVVSFPLRFVTPYGLLGAGHPLRRLENNVVTQFLLSTDFFQHGADETRRVNYVAFYDPVKTPCRNPFAGVAG